MEYQGTWEYGQYRKRGNNAEITNMGISKEFYGAC